LEKTYYVRPELTSSQEAFYRAWRKAFEDGEAWMPEEEDEETPVNYLFAYTKDILPEARIDPGVVAARLERLGAAYRRVRSHATCWARDAWLLAGDMRGALECVPRQTAGRVASFETDMRLTLKYLLRVPVDAWDVFAMFNPKITGIMKEHIDEVTELVEARLQAEREAGNDLLGNLLRQPKLQTSAWPLWNATLQSLPVEAARIALVSKLPTAKRLAESLQLEAENALREDKGLPHVGQGWISETRLYVSLREALDTNVIQHGTPGGFGRQHLDVWIPEWHVGLEYQGLQHDQPLAHFGGEAAFEGMAKRDREKRLKAQRLGIEIVYVRPGYELNQVIVQIHESRQRAEKRRVDPRLADG
jgi:hypothetical protein